LTRGTDSGTRGGADFRAAFLIGFLTATGVIDFLGANFLAGRVDLAPSSLLFLLVVVDLRATCCGQAQAGARAAAMQISTPRWADLAKRLCN
jgi:hypothetical protein